MKFIKSSMGIRGIYSGEPLIENKTKIKILHMRGNPQYNGKIYVLRTVDDAGQIHLHGCTLAVIPNIDIFEVINE